ncbi:hypothetical protein TNCV_4029751, partial [Trichonephila clavipes]
RRRTTTSAARRLTSSIRKKNSTTTVRNRLTMQVCMQEDTFSCVQVFPNGRQRRNRLCWAREHALTQQQWASVLFTDESRFTMESDSGRLLI